MSSDVSPAESDRTGCAPHGSESCLTCLRRADSEWGALSDDGIRRLDAGRTFDTYAPGQALYRQGQPALGVFCLESGEVVQRRTDEHGDTVVSGVVLAGRTLGYRAFFVGGTHEETAEAVSPTRACFIDRATVRALLDEDSRLGHRFLRSVSTDLSASEQARIEMATLSVRQRLAHFILALKDRRGTAGPSGSIVIELLLQRQDIASLLGTRPETIARTVRDMEAEGIARFEGRRVVVPDLDLLLDELER